MTTRPLTVAVDFDGTIVEHRYPEIGPLVPGALETLLELQHRGARLILWTVRGGVDLDAAVAMLEQHGLVPWAVNRNPESFELSPKVFCDVFVDDRALGCPLRPDSRGRNMVDWRELGPALLRMAGRVGAG